MVLAEADVAHVNHHPPAALTCDRVPTVELQVELQDVHRGLAEECKIAAAAVLRQDRTDLFRAGVAGPGHPGHLQNGVRPWEVRGQAAPPGGPRVGRDLW